jgi:AraC-like DNA-binding protein
MHPSEKFLTFTPQHPALQGLVAYFYWHGADSPSFETRFTYYPHYRNAITVYIDSDVSFNDAGSEIKPGPRGAHQVLYSRNYERAISVDIAGPFKKFGIAFEPLGVNAFLPRPLSAYAPLRVNAFNAFGAGFTELVCRAASDPSPDVLAGVESFLVSQLHDNRDPRILRAVKVMLKNEADVSVGDLSAEIGINRKTLLRLFQNHLCISPESYKKLIRFRNALNDYLSSDKKTTFTALALDHHYYDQPAFINHFKSITGDTPRTFFAKLQQYGEKDTYWSPK